SRFWIRASSMGASLTLARVMSAESGTPRLSTRRWSFIPGLARSVGLGPFSFPPLGRSDRGPISRLPVEGDAVLCVIQVQAAAPDVCEHARSSPFGEAVVDRLPLAELLRHGTPWHD